MVQKETLLQEKIINRHLLLESLKFFSGIGIIVITGVLFFLSNILHYVIPTQLGYAFIAGAYIAASSKIKSYKDILNLI